MSFAEALCSACGRHGWNPMHPLAVMMSESGINPAAHNPNGDASGLIQFMPDTLLRLGWHNGHQMFRTMSAEEQVPYVEAYYSPYPDLDSPERFYLATFLPALLSLDGSHDPEFPLCGERDALVGAYPGILWRADGKGLGRDPYAWAHRANRVFDRENKGYIILDDLRTSIMRACHGAKWEAESRAVLEVLGSTAPPPPTTKPELNPEGPVSETMPGTGPTILVGDIEPKDE